MKTEARFLQEERQNFKQIIIKGVLIILTIILIMFFLFSSPRSSFYNVMLFWWLSFDSAYVFYDSRKRYPSLIWNLGLAIICTFPILFFVYLWLRPPAVFETPQINLIWKILFVFNAWLIIINLAKTFSIAHFY